MARPTIINGQRADDFLEHIEDPIVKTLVRYSYQTMCMSDAVPEGDFDLFYFFTIMEEFLRDREGLSKALIGQFGENITGWGE